ncbi:MAG: hypothetical protein J07HQW2_01357 [Haloquadratum walsbyi J07HQW2]|jgi:hypothetical protein|uniref:Uncharacterized protein n=1 Tax=Haloquadratum walsbyi J07HQW2 TaxID=1238425 RepID=U1ND98_9EURY|nr:MAG: hypothetical protein J07HQW2_01357 [Haloquadratum walsbyi J07HQW2]
MNRNYMSRDNPSLDIFLIECIHANMPQIHVDDETIARLDSLREDDEDYNAIVTELLNIYETEELTLFHSGDG